MGKNPYDYDEIVRKRFQAALRHTMQAQGLSPKSLGRAVGIDHRTIEAYLDGSNTPTHINEWRLIKYFGATFLNDLAEPAGIVGAFDQEDRQGCPHAVITQMSQFLHVLAKAVEDGHIDEYERQQIIRDYPILNTVLKAFMGGL